MSKQTALILGWDMVDVQEKDGEELASKSPILRAECQRVNRRSFRVATRYRGQVFDATVSDGASCGTLCDIDVAPCPSRLLR